MCIYTLALASPLTPDEAELRCPLDAAREGTFASTDFLGIKVKISDLPQFESHSPPTSLMTEKLKARKRFRMSRNGD